MGIDSSDINARHAVETFKMFQTIIGEQAELFFKDFDPEKMASQYKKLIIEHLDSISISWRKRVGDYVNVYNIYPENGVYDEFKTYYFIGMAAAEKLNSIGSSELSVLQTLAVLKLMDSRLETVKAARAPLTYRLTQIIEKGRIEADFGRFGWLVMYTCLHRAAQERSRILK